MIGILRKGKARFMCAAAGIALAVGALVFTSSLVMTNNAQAPAAARTACAPWSAWQIEDIQLGFRRGDRPREKRGDRPHEKRGDRPHDCVAKKRGDRPHDRVAKVAEKCDLELKAIPLTIDYRPGGHVLQGPPMFALLAKAPSANPYGAVALTEGRWVDESSTNCEVVCVRAAMRRFKASAPKLGENIKFVGKNCTMTAKIVGYLDGSKLPPQFPGVFANNCAFQCFSCEKIGCVRFFREKPIGGDRPRNDAFLSADSPEVVAAFKSDEQKRMDYARPLLLVAAFLTALSLLVNSLLLSVEANRGILSTLRTVGLTRGGVVGFVFSEALVASVVGWVVGVAGAAGALACWVSSDATAFPAGIALDVSRIRMTLFILPVIVFLAVLFALRPALKVRPMDPRVRLPRPRRRGMAVTFACGFAAFVAVEVWGASLMRAFVPSPEWPDAIVSILPSGVSSFDVEKLRTVEGVRRVSELVPRQLPLADCEDSDPRSRGAAERSETRIEAEGRHRRNKVKSAAGRATFPNARNALFLGAEWLPKFKFIEGTWSSAEQALLSSDAVVITEMMMNAHNLHKGDTLVIRARLGRGGAEETLRFPIAGVVDLNWHMVTSRGLVRGLNGASPMTDGPVFCSLDTMGIVDPRTYLVEPALSAPMTHLWIEYEPAFLAKHGVFPAGRLIEAEIAKRLGNPTGSTVRLHARDEIADGTLAHGSDLIGQVARVPFVFLAILAIGFVEMLVAEADARRREFGVLRAVGATRGQVARLLIATAVRTALAGIVLALPVGALVGWLFTFRTGNWPGLPHWFVLPWPVVLEGALGALVFALAFAVPTALMLVGRNRA